MRLNATIEWQLINVLIESNRSFSFNVTHNQLSISSIKTSFFFHHISSFLVLFTMIFHRFTFAGSISIDWLFSWNQFCMNDEIIFGWPAFWHLVARLIFSIFFFSCVQNYLIYFSFFLCSLSIEILQVTQTDGREKWTENVSKKLKWNKKLQQETRKSGFFFQQMRSNISTSSERTTFQWECIRLKLQ